MEILQYPLDGQTLLRKKLKLKKELSVRPELIEKRIAVLGGSTTNEVVDQLELFLLDYGIKPVFYQSEYAQYWQDAMFGNPELDAFAPDVVYIHTNWRNVTAFLGGTVYALLHDVGEDRGALPLPDYPEQF